MTGLFISAATVLALVCSGYVMQKRKTKGSTALYAAILCVSCLLVLGGVIMALAPSAQAAEAPSQAAGYGIGEGLGFLAAALATAISCLAAAYTVANVGSSAIGLIAEKPEMLGATLIYLGLSEGIAIYGLIVSMLILQKF